MTKYKIRKPKTEIRRTAETRMEDAWADANLPMVREGAGEKVGESSRPAYDLEQRTEAFSAAVRLFIKRLPHTVANVEDVRQLVRSSGSVGANYIEANEALGRKDFLYRIKTSRKEAKESRYWLRLLDVGGDRAIEAARAGLVQEATELMNIFGAIFRKSSAT